jgi:branched-chain amino acid aminotransferase
MSILRGYGVFDFLRTYGGHPFHLDDHLNRLKHSAESIGLKLPGSIKEISDIIKTTLKKNGHKESNIRVVVTGGRTDDFMMPSGNPRLLVMVTPLHTYPERWYVNGVKIITVPIERSVPGAKSINYLSAIMALKKAYEKGAAEAVYTDRFGNFREGTTSNFFAFINGKLVTPGTGEILPGITRQVILALAKEDFEINICNISLENLSSIREAFISASNKEVVPVVKINDYLLGDGKPGKSTRQIMKKFSDYTRKWTERQSSTFL